MRARNWREVQAEALQDGRITEDGNAEARRMTLEELQRKYPPADREEYDRARATAVKLSYLHPASVWHQVRHHWWLRVRYGKPDGYGKPDDSIGYAADYEVALWEIYKLAGEDPDGDEGPDALIAGNGPAGFARIVVEAVRELRQECDGD